MNIKHLNLAILQIFFKNLAKFSTKSIRAKKSRIAKKDWNQLINHTYLYPYIVVVSMGKFF